MRRRHIVGIGIAAILVLAAYYFYGGSSVPKGQQPLLRLNPSNLPLLTDAFNRSRDSVRVLVLVSPT
jgi:hypothetical protein